MVHNNQSKQNCGEMNNGTEVACMATISGGPGKELDQRAYSPAPEVEQYIPLQM
jgi:hypothetical protein